jgi:ATP-dependent DNA helicase RecG
MTLDYPVARLPAVNPKVAQGLERLGIKKIRDLLFYFPSRHEDRRVISKISEIVPGTSCVLKGKMEKVSAQSTFRRHGARAKRVLITNAVLRDESGEMPLVWFHQKFIEKNYPSGTNVYVVGTPTLGDKGIAIVAPEVERIIEGKEPVHTARLVPVYSETEGVTSRFLRYLMSRSLPLTENLVDYLPSKTREEEQLLSFAQAIRNLHFPASEEELFESRKRLAFDELFILQLAALVRKKERMQEKSTEINFAEKKLEEMKKNLPFSLTPSQNEALKKIIEDLKCGVPMNRLVAGDVGSGKTIVAGLSAFSVYLSGGQAALVAPTEILAVQHTEGLQKFFSVGGMKIALLTGSTKPKERENIFQQVEAGEINLLVGTHALFHSRLKFKKLGLIIVDEQHRFGVDQRDELTKKGTDGQVPHFLSLTATPIPRTLQLTAYGDVDVTMLDPRPDQRIVKTEVISPEGSRQIYESLAERMKKGEQVFVICPRVEVSDNPDDEVKSVILEYENLRTIIFPDFKIGMVHGKLPADEKKKVLEEFREGKLDMLVASSVVEVGVDIPGATALLIEGAERFGLAQLHQFRGRVGRRGQEAICYLASSSNDPQALSRLNVLAENNDGLKIAEEDLKRRGAGEIYGTRQSGGVKLKIANITDVPFLLRVRKAAERLLERDPKLKSADLINKRIRQLNVTTHFE